MTNDYAIENRADNDRAADDDYTSELRIAASLETVHSALTTLAGCSAWWAPASGSTAPGGQLLFTFDNPLTPLVLRVREASAARVVWHVEACDFLPDWVGTTIAFSLTPSGDGDAESGCELRFRHFGLNADLECYGQCRAGWEHFLPSLRAYAESVAGRPHRPA